MFGASMTAYVVVEYGGSSSNRADKLGNRKPPRGRARDRRLSLGKFATGTLGTDFR